MKIYKYKINIVFAHSILFALILFAASIPWISVFFEYNLKKNVLYMILFCLFVLLAIFFIFIFVFSCFTFYIYENKIVKEFKMFSYTKKSVEYFNKDEIILISSGNFILSIFYQTRMQIYKNKKTKMLSLVMDKNEANDLISNMFDLENMKTHYVKNEDFFYNKNNVLYLIINYLAFFVLLYAIYVAVILPLKFDVINIIGIEMNTIVFGLIIALVLTFFASLFNVIHNSNTALKIDKNYLRLERGRIFTRRIIMPSKLINSFEISSALGSKVLKTYNIIYKVTRHKNIKIPVHKENIESLVNGEINQFTKKKNPFLWRIFLISEIIVIGSSIGILFLNYISAILFFCVFSYFVFSSTLSHYLIYFKGNIIIRKHFLSTKYKVIDRKDIKKIYISKAIFKNSYITFFLDNYKVKTISNSLEAEAIKEIFSHK